VIYLMPGSHKLEARQGTSSTSRTLEAVAGQRVYVTLELRQGHTTPAEPAPPPLEQPGSEPLASSPTPGAPPMDDQPSTGFFRWLGNSPGAIATVTVAGLSLGTSAVLAGFASNRYAAANNARDQILDQLRENRSRDVLTADATPCGESGLASGVGPISDRVSENQRNSLIEGYAAACSTFTERSDSGDRLKTLSLVSLGVGVAATMGTVVWYFTDTGGSRSDSGRGKTGLDSARVTPVIGPDGGSVSVEFAF
jgi:hypothetical protein